jgi:hypothetical protein
MKCTPFVKATVKADSVLNLTLDATARPCWFSCWIIVEIEMKLRYWETQSLREYFSKAYVGNPAQYDERLGVLYGNHIRRQIKTKTGLSRFQRITYVFLAKGCYTDT